MLPVAGEMMPFSLGLAQELLTGLGCVSSFVRWKSEIKRDREMMGRWSGNKERERQRSDGQMERKTQREREGYFERHDHKQRKTRPETDEQNTPTHKTKGGGGGGVCGVRL